MHRYALAVTRDPHLAADIVQDTVVRALERADQYRGDAPMEHWLIRIAHNLLVDRLRRSEREISVEEVEDDWRDDDFTVDAEQPLRRGRMALVSALAAGEERRAMTRGVPMRCWDARQHVSEYLDRELDEPTAAAVEAHLATCPTCPPLYAALVGVHDQLGKLRDPDSVIDPDLEGRLRALVRGG